MDSNLLNFVRRFAGFVAAALIPVVLIAFFSIPVNLSRHPGEPSTTTHPLRHMT